MKVTPEERAQVLWLFDHLQPDVPGAASMVRLLLAIYDAEPHHPVYRKCGFGSQARLREFRRTGKWPE
jgi:hypothetical protein